MKIAVYLSQFIPETGGAYTFEKSIADALQKIESNHEFVFYYATNFFKTVLLNHTLKKEKIDLLYSPSWFFNKIDIPYITTVWDLQHRLQPYFPEVSSNWRWVRREIMYNTLLKPASYIITGTGRGKSEIINFYNIAEERIRTIPFPTPDFALNPSVTTDSILEKYSIHGSYIYYPAQFWPHKNHVALLKALKILKEDYSINISLVLSGSDKGNLGYIKKKTKEAGLENQVYFLGFVPEKSLIELYKNAFALVFPTYFGPDNIPPLEAFGLGCPVIASKVPGAEEQLGDACLFFNPSKPKEIAEQIKNLYDNNELRTQLITKGKERAQHNTAENYVKKLLDIFDEFESYRECRENN